MFGDPVLMYAIVLLIFVCFLYITIFDLCLLSIKLYFNLPPIAFTMIPCADLECYFVGQVLTLICVSDLDLFEFLLVVTLISDIMTS